MAFCSVCGTQVADGTTMCAAHVAAGSGGAATATTQAGGLSENVAGMLAYVTIIPAIVFLVVAPYNRSKFIRFHSFQCIFLTVAWVALGIAMSIIGMIPVLGWVTLAIWPVIGLAGLALWVILLIKANQGQMWKVPFIGDMAEKQASAM
jgi:uncharacterized membrane protein